MDTVKECFDICIYTDFCSSGHSYSDDVYCEYADCEDSPNGCCCSDCQYDRQNYNPDCECMSETYSGVIVVNN